MVCCRTVLIMWKDIDPVGSHCFRFMQHIGLGVKRMTWYQCGELQSQCNFFSITNQPMWAGQNSLCIKFCSFPVVWFYLRNYKPFSRTEVFFTWLLYNVGSFYCQFSCIVAQETVTTTVIRGSKTAKLTATLSGGNGDAAWQQAQLFSQPINDNDSSLEITITLQDVKW